MCSSRQNDHASRPHSLLSRMQRPETTASPAAPTALAPLLTAAGAISPETDRVLTRLANAARSGDPHARMTLYWALEPKINRFVAGCRYRAWQSPVARRDGRPWEIEDLAQEAFVIFSALVADWSGEGSFIPYFFAHFPWRLRNAWRALVWPHRHTAPLSASRLCLLADDSAAAAEAHALLTVVAATLPALDGEILLAHIGDGLPLQTVARRLGLGRATVTRRWRVIRERLRRELIAGT